MSAMLKDFRLNKFAFFFLHIITTIQLFLALRLINKDLKQMNSKNMRMNLELTHQINWINTNCSIFQMT